jgi:hypothetical protein
VQRLVGVFVVIVCAAGVLAACSSSTDDANHPSPTVRLIEKAAAKTEAEPWMHFRWASPSKTQQLTLEETSNPRETIASGSTTTGTSSLPFAAVDGIYYVDASGAPTAKLQPGKRWVSIDQSLVPSNARRAVGDQLALLAHTLPDVGRLRRETVNGVVSQGYRVRIPTSAFLLETGIAASFEQTVAGAAGTASLKDVYKQLGVGDATGFFEKLYGSQVSADVYVGGGLVRRLTVSPSPEAGKLSKVPQMRHVAESLAAKTQIDLLGLPAKLEVAKPDSSQVQTVSSFDDYVAALNGTNSAN